MSKNKRFFSSGNPVMNEKAFQKATETVLDGDLVGSQPIEVMTTQGAISKTFMLMGLLLLTTLVGYAFPSPLTLWGGAIGGLAVVILSVFKKQWSPVLAPIYALLEGLFVGAISAIYAAQYAGIVFQAVTLTMAVLFMMLFIYKMEIIKVTEKFRAGVMMATGAIVIVYVASWILSFFGINMPYIHEAGPIGIGISLVIVGVAALNLLLDFDNFEKGEQMRAPKYMEWFCAMGLLITLVWLYVEMLRLLSKLSSD